MAVDGDDGDEIGSALPSHNISWGRSKDSIDVLLGFFFGRDDNTPWYTRYFYLLSVYRLSFYSCCKHSSGWYERHGGSMEGHGGGREGGLVWDSGKENRNSYYLDKIDVNLVALVSRMWTDIGPNQLPWSRIKFKQLLHHLFRVFFLALKTAPNNCNCCHLIADCRPPYRNASSRTRTTTTMLCHMSILMMTHLYFTIGHLLGFLPNLQHDCRECFCVWCGHTLQCVRLCKSS